jgi:hypothetical protein
VAWRSATAGQSGRWWLRKDSEEQDGELGIHGIIVVLLPSSNRIGLLPSVPQTAESSVRLLRVSRSRSFIGSISAPSTG